jgi:hypothetical protein
MKNAGFNSNQLIAWPFPSFIYFFALFYASLIHKLSVWRPQAFLNLVFIFALCLWEGSLKGIVSWNRMTIWQFYCIAGNFLIIRWRILNFKIFVFYFKIFKNSVSPLWSCGGTFHWREALRRENFSPQRKILFPYGTYFLQISLAWTPAPTSPHTRTG